MQDRIDRLHSKQPGLQKLSRGKPATRREAPLTAVAAQAFGHPSDQCGPASSATSRTDGWPVGGGGWGGLVVSRRRGARPRGRPYSGQRWRRREEAVLWWAQSIDSTIVFWIVRFQKMAVTDVRIRTQK